MSMKQMNRRKVAVVGAGAVGATFAYALAHDASKCLHATQ